MSLKHQLRISLPTAMAYLVLASLTASLTRFDAGVAFIWVANALLTARLLTSPRRRWTVTAASCGVASIVATSLFGLGTAAALPMAAVNIAEAYVAAFVLRRISIPQEPMQSLRWLSAFVIATGLVAPALSGILAAGVATIFGHGGYLANLFRWFAGHSLGGMTFTPIFMLAYRLDLRAAWNATRAGEVTEAAVLLLLVTATSVAVFAQRGMPLLFLPMLPIILATFRTGRVAASMSVVILAVVGGGFTLAHKGPVALIGGTAGDQMQFLQFYLAATVLTVLPIAADLARRASLFRRLRDSEARYRLLADNSTDIILNLDVEGRIRFVSSSITQLGGYMPEDLLGTNAVALVTEAHRPGVQRAHLAALRVGNGDISCVEYQGKTRSGELRWFETRSRAVLNADGSVDGVVSIIRDIEERKMVEGRLSDEARTDPLTGLLNRRAFDAKLRDVTAGFAPSDKAGCVALFDIDYFKRVNDTFGHAAGDRVLKQFALAAVDSVRAGDVVARIGGEEFALLLPGATVEQATAVCERLRIATAGLVVEDAGREIRITASGGVAPLAAGGERQVLRDADVALYMAKNAGRNRFAWAA